MPIEVITEFLGKEPENENIEGSDKQLYFYYTGVKLKYGIALDLERNVFNISGDPECPFDFSSLFEVSVEFDSITIEYEPQFYTDQKILVCRKNYKNHKNVKTLMIVKWRHGELSVWPPLLKCENIDVNYR